jgi:hypothetical protein
VGRGEINQDISRHLLRHTGGNIRVAYWNVHFPIRKLKMKKEADLYLRASDAGARAGHGVKVEPMLVGSPSTLLGNDVDPTKPTYVVEGGVCGFAGVVISPARGKFVSYLKWLDRGHKHYYGGYYVPCDAFGQSLVRKEAWCRAFVEVLGEAGIGCYSHSRMD